MIFFRKEVRCSEKQTLYDLEQKINDAVFPGLQSGPHNHAIGGVAVALAEAKSPQFIEYQTQVNRVTTKFYKSLSCVFTFACLNQIFIVLGH